MTIEQFKQRKSYDEKLSGDYFNQNFIDFTKLNRYGMVDQKNNMIYARSEKAKPFGKSGEKVVLSFVSVAYEAMMRELGQRVINGQWEKDSIFLQFNPEVAMTNPVISYTDFISRELEMVSVLFFKKKNLTDFKSYLSLFQDFLSSVKYNFPMTFVGFLERENNPSTTGLQVSFVEEQKNNFSLKYDIINDPAFKRFLLLTEKHGFLVNRDTPWTIMANIDSPAMQVYASQDAGINIGTAGILKRYFSKASTISFKFFVDYLMGAYNSIVEVEPKYEYLEAVPDGCKPYRKNTIIRERITDPKAEYKKNAEILQMLYLTVRYYENFADKQKFKQVLRKYREELKVKRYAFPDLVEELVGPAKNSSVLFYELSGATSVTSFEYSFEAEEFAAKIGGQGAHQMPNGRWMPCNTHEEYIALTSR